MDPQSRLHSASPGAGGRDDRAPKKRTKTGCQTCRNRRIKCDETKPACNNCTKGKRICEAIEAGDNEADCGEGYGPRTGPREASAAAGDNKRSRRFVPYESPERRTYKTIIPAPPKQRAKGSPLSSAGETPAIVPLALPPTAETHIPKRPRLEPEHPEPAGHTAPEQFVEQAPEVVLDVIEPVAPPPFTEYQYRYRYGDANRITISSLLTIDPESIAEYQSTQALHQYIPSFYFSSPLTDPTLVFAFKHFVEVVAPTMSLVESAPPNPSILNYQNYPDPGARAVNLFTFQLPMMALAGNWAVMEAILALSLLHIAHVTRSSKQQAYLHYQIAIKRLRIESSREGASRDLGILAVMLLLAWYELTTGDHLKWVRHMTGAIAVLQESSRWRATPEATSPATAVPTGEVDLSTPTSQTSTANQPLEGMPFVTDEIQVSTGRILLHELFYLYAKMDVIQALVRGAPPLLELSEWRYPLRGPSTTVLGLHDALIHLMARLAHLIASERDRKSALPKFPAPTISSHHSPQSTSSTPPSTFSRSSPASSQTTLDAPIDALALEAWENLSKDFSKWKDAIDLLRHTRIETNMPTPFGPAIIYSDLRVAAAYTLFLAARIHLNRVHPSTPSFAPAATAMTAAQNGALVAEICRTQEGLWEQKNFRHVGVREDGRTVGGDGRVVDHAVSALTNCAWPMLVGGVQVRVEEQQRWMKKRLCDIYELSGFATAIRVLKGLEIAWGHRVRGQPSGFDDLDSDDENDKSLIAREQRVQEKELNSRREYVREVTERRFVLVKEGERYLGDLGDHPDIPFSYAPEDSS